MLGRSIAIAPIAALRWLCIAALLAATGGCRSIPPALPTAPPPEVAVRPAQFTIEADALDTWNAVGQLLVRYHGVTYEGRAQMLGLYDIDYRGERFLIVTRALVLGGDVRVTTTQVRAALRNGKADGSAAAIELLASLEQQLPGELQRIAAEKKTPAAKHSHPRPRHR